MKLNVNGKALDLDVEADTPLLWALRERQPTICVVAPAVMNAIHAATGKPVRSLPLKNLKLV